jgi:hypothetical protein
LTGFSGWPDAAGDAGGRRITRGFMRVCLLTDEVMEDFNPAVYLKNYDWDYVTVRARCGNLSENFNGNRTMCT